MRLLMMGTGPFALPTFRRLYQTRHNVAGLVTGPVRSHRGKPVEPAAAPRSGPRARHAGLRPGGHQAPDAQARLAGLGADLLVVCDYGQILAPATLAVASLGGINLHASLLPKYRGAAPINWAIYHGETQTGVTVIHITPQLDAGPCIAQARVAIGPDETAVELEARLAELVRRWSRDDRPDGVRRRAPIPQDAALASKAPRLKKPTGRSTGPAQRWPLRIRFAPEPWPKTYTYWHPPPPCRCG